MEKTPTVSSTRCSSQSDQSRPNTRLTGFPTPNIQCAPIRTDQTLSLRQSVLWPNKPLSHVQLPEDDHGWHFGAFIPTSPHPVAVISLFLERYPIDVDVADLLNPPLGVARIRKFACHPDHQGRGIGTKLLMHTTAFAFSDLAATYVWCDARVATAEWYERRGLVAFGDQFLKGDVPYIRMGLAKGNA